MTDLKFILSNPPHHESDLDHVSSILGLSVAEARAKLNFPGPEVWFVAEENEDLTARTDDFCEAGVNVKVTSGQMVVGLSDRLEVRGFAFRDQALELRAEGADPIEIPYDWAVHSVYCRPLQLDPIDRRTMRQSARAASANQSHRQQARKRLSAIKVPVDRSFVDLFFTDGATVIRATMWPGRTEFSGLLEEKCLAQRQNTEKLIQMLGTRFPSAFDDRRLENAPDPRITLLGRRTLRGHLELVDSSMKDIHEHDLLSRLAFLSRHTPV